MAMEIMATATAMAVAMVMIIVVLRWTIYRCPVCHDNFNLPCRTSCSHWFRGECILRAWLYGDAMQPCMCPLCASLITSLSPLHPGFDDGPRAQQVMQLVTRYNRLHVGGL